MLDNTANQATKFWTKNWVKINHGSHRVYNIDSQIKLKYSMIRSDLCDYSDAYILVKETITVPNTRTAAVPNNKNKNIIFKNCAPFTDCISKRNNKEIDHAKDIDVVLPMYNLIEYSDNYLKTSGSFWQYYKDELFVNDDGTKDVQILVPLKYLSNF